MTIDVSIIIATYNVEAYIERAVLSALHQEGVSVEIIFVDDCSTDNSFYIAESIKDSRIKCFKTIVNSGPGAARNIGLKEATGKWIAILDGDDSFEKNRLSNCLSEIKSGNAHIIVDNLMVCPEDQKINSYPMFDPKKFSRLKNLDLSTFIKGKISPFDKYTLGYLKPIFSTSFLKQHNLMYSTDIKIGEDYLLMMEALASGAICKVSPAMGYFYTARTGSISHRLTSRDVAEMIKADAVLQERYQFSATAQIEQTRRTAILKDLYAYNLLVEAIKQKCFSDIWKAVKLHPVAIRHLWQPVWKRIKQI